MSKILSRNFFATVVIIIAGHIAMAQPNSISIKCFVKKNTVLLRWATTDKELWTLGNKYGYQIDRIQLPSANDPDTPAFHSSTLLTSAPIRPIPESDTAYWKILIKQNPNAALLYSLIYSKSNTAQTNAKQKEAADKLLFGLALISCDHSSVIAKAAGLFYTDSVINNDSIYAYRIRLSGPSKNITFKHAMIVVDARKFSRLPEIDSLSGKFRNKRISLRWKAANNKKHFGAYIIERSEDSLNFSPVSKTPYVLAYTQFEKERNFAEYSDSVPQFNKTYFYRVRGLSHFGEEGPPGNTISVKTKVLIDGFPVIDSINITGNKHVMLYWKMPASIDPKILKGFAITRSVKADGNYEYINSSLLPPGVLRYTDEKPQHINYYKICAISLSNDSVFSFPAMVQPEDREPPQIPKGLSGAINSSGIVKLQWISNNETDLMGYRVFRSNSIDGEFVEATKKIIVDTVFTDTVNVNTLARNICYSLVAVDLVYNNSGYSAPVKLPRPDKSAPTPAVISSILFDKNGINIKWIKSSSDDVNKYVLGRQDRDQPAKTKIIREWSVTDTTSFYSDTTVAEGNTYTYSLTTIDSSGNSSQWHVPAIHFEPGLRKKITNLSATANRNERKIELKWQYQQPGIQNFILYKSKKGDPLRIYKTLPGNLNSFTDTEASINNVYFYALKAVFLNGAESELSDVIEVNY
ncbi:MAG: hypothetical protein HYU69_15820 [Bacteroidetes bacterium]|nr:hypothetical protein [Bacteroidota bacterium]